MIHGRPGGAWDAVYLRPLALPIDWNARINCGIRERDSPLTSGVPNGFAMVTGCGLPPVSCPVRPNQLMDYLGGAFQESFNARVDRDLAMLEVEAEHISEDAVGDLPDQMELATNEEMMVSAADAAEEQQDSEDSALDLDIPCHGLPPEAVISAQERCNMPGASTSDKELEALFDLTTTACSSSWSSRPAFEDLLFSFHSHALVGSTIQRALRIHTCRWV